MAAHSQVSRQSDQRHRHGAQGQDQEQPDHPHDVLGYQNEVERAGEASGLCESDKSARAAKAAKRMQPGA
jgi:hypothetical protein